MQNTVQELSPTMPGYCVAGVCWPQQVPRGSRIPEGARKGRLLEEAGTRWDTVAICAASREGLVARFDRYP